MYQNFTKIYLFLLIVWIVENSESKQGACLSYGHSCWGAHGKRNENLSNNPNSWFLYKMAMMHKNDNVPIELRHQSNEGNLPNYFNILKTYMRNFEKNINSEDYDSPSNLQLKLSSSKYVEPYMEPENHYRITKL
ncbi:uncharacterized protein LOC126907687 [Daktulosphaira vitifoliae]|uniref:uncharacterized protein LOC126907687 n=1 Tax=Daktulosphaira vitifoliae TaxID=58002 RepID=UPI0021A983D8|nr:uncharacterized protein LOC126907687 [Daktulosphaira vitifoliae]